MIVLNREKSRAETLRVGGGDEEAGVMSNEGTGASVLQMKKDTAKRTLRPARAAKATTLPADPTRDRPTMPPTIMINTPANF